jgi:CheY-like chemotaxis protein
MNLAVNARDAMPHGGKLVIETENVCLDKEYSRVSLGAVAGEYVVLSVSDTGDGMDRETLDHIYEPFFTTKAAGKGTGLGLATVYGIVKQHGGYITCSSERGDGTKFRIYFPAAKENVEQGVTATGTMPAFGTETVLLVDDEELVRELGKRILTRAGYTVLTAGNGREALELYRGKKDEISVVILDLIMPQMGGTKCLKQLLEIDPHAVVLISSGYAADSGPQECIELGAKGFVGKPFKINVLLQQVRKTLNEG